MTDFRTCQRRLLAAGYEIGAIDNIAGPKTWAGIMAYVGRRQLSLLMPYGGPAATILPRYGISTRLRISNFIGQAAHETGGFRLMREVWGPTAAQRSYDGRLGNTRPGDGYRYRGRGIFQITGRANYDEIGAALKIDLEDCPELAESPPVAIEAAAYFWQSRGLNTLADTGDEDGITRRINGGFNGRDERRALVDRCKGLFA